MDNRERIDRFSEEVKRVYGFFNRDSRDLFRDLIDLTHGKGKSEYIFWISAEGMLEEAPKGHQEKPWFMTSPDELALSKHSNDIRGRVGRTTDGQQFIMVYNPKEQFIISKRKVKQLQRGIESMPIPIDDNAVVVAGGEVLGTVMDLSTF